MARYFEEARQHRCANTSGSPVSSLPCSLSAWVWYASTPAGDRYFVANDTTTSYMWLGVSTTPRLSLFLDGGTATISLSHTRNSVAKTWYHMVGVCASSTDHKLYVDGELVDTDTTDIGSWSANRLYVVAPGGEGSMYHTCAVADFAVYNMALTAADVKRLSTGRFRPPDVQRGNLKALFDLNRGEANTKERNHVVQSTNYALTYANSGGVSNAVWFPDPPRLLREPQGIWYLPEAGTPLGDGQPFHMRRAGIPGMRTFSNPAGRGW